MENRIFFPQAVVDRWMVDGAVDLSRNELTIVSLGRRFEVVDAVRVVREVSETGDVHGLVGRVKERTALEELGAEIVETSMLLGDAAFDVEPGWLGRPTPPFAEYAAAAARSATLRATDAPTTDEDLVLRFAAQQRGA